MFSEGEESFKKQLARVLSIWQERAVYDNNLLDQLSQVLCKYTTYPRLQQDYFSLCTSTVLLPHSSCRLTQYSSILLQYLSIEVVTVAFPVLKDECNRLGVWDQLIY